MFDYEKFDSFLSRGLCEGKGSPGGQVCIEVAIALCSGENFGDAPTCVHPAVRSHSIRLNDANWSSPEARAAGMRDYGLAQLGTQSLDAVRFARRLAFLTITKLLPGALRLAKLETEALACEKADSLDLSLMCARVARKAAAAAAAYAAAYAAYADADADADAAYADAAYAAYAAYADADAAAAYAAAYAAADAAARDKVLTLAAQLATQAIQDTQNGFVQP